MPPAPSVRRHKKNPFHFSQRAGRNPGEEVRQYMYSTGQKKRFGYLVGNLVATNWPIEKALHEIGCN